MPSRRKAAQPVTEETPQNALEITKVCALVLDPGVVIRPALGSTEHANRSPAPNDGAPFAPQEVSQAHLKGARSGSIV